MIYIHALTGHIAHEPREGYLPLHEADKPVPGPGQIVVEDATVREADRFVRHWKLIDAPRHRVSKDSLMSRVAAAGDQYVLALDDVLQAQPRARQILWRDFAWFHSDNASVRALISAIGLDPAVILAPEDSDAS